MKKFIIGTDILKTILDKVGQAVNANTIIPSLKDILVEIKDGSATFTTSDAEMTIVYRHDIEADFDAKFLLPFDFINKVVLLNKKMPLAFTIEKKGLKIQGENDNYELSSLTKLSDFPKLPEMPSDHAEAELPDFLPFLKTALLTVSKDWQNKPNLCKVLLEIREGKITVASTDGSWHVFSYAFEAPSKNSEDLLLSPKVVKALDGLQNISVSWSEKIICFSGTDITVMITRPEEKFANFRSIFPEDFVSNLSINRSELETALEKCSLSSDQFKTTKFNLQKNIGLSAVDSVYGININVSLPNVQYTGNVDNVCVSADKLLKLLHQISFDTIELAIHDSRRAILIRCTEDAGYLSLIMPISA